MTLLHRDGREKKGMIRYAACVLAIFILIHVPAHFTSGAIPLLSCLIPDSYAGHGARENDDSALDPQLEGFDLVYVFPDTVPFRAGERLEFKIQYGLIYAGDATLEVKGITMIDSIRAYHIVSEARTREAFDYFFKVRDRVESYMDTEILNSLRFEKHLREGNFKKDEEVIFDQRRHVAIYPDGEMMIAPNTQDFLSALYYFRSLSLDVGQAISMANHTGKKNYPIYIKVLRRETVSVPAGEFDCIAVEPVLQTSSIFKHRGKLTIWLTDDKLRMPVLLRSKVVVGSFEAVLTDYTLGGWEGRATSSETDGE